MVTVLVAIIGGFIAQTCIIWLFHRHLMREIDNSLLELDQRLAEAAIKLSEGGPVSAPDVNPMQMLLMQLIQQKMASPRSEAGQFVKKTTEKVS